MESVGLPGDFEEAELDLDFLVSYNLKRVYSIFLNDFRYTLSQDSVSARGFAALSLVVQVSHITQSELARKLGIERSGIVAIIDELENEGFLKRTLVRNDKRIYALLPTPAGARAYKKALGAVKKSESCLLSVLTPTEKKQLVPILRKIRANHTGNPPA
ncbi:hypothetical protein AB833_20675 [Chromatiales bacterium (ex Bugula neritina AB1)]|nr:hypothetical protein AB833_20675 [Chromatiales bacterium (ex Bugula neritina AB1)]